MKDQKNPSKYAVIGLVFVLPFLILNAIIANQWQPFFSFIRPTVHSSVLEIFLLFLSLLLILIGGIVSLMPLIKNKKIFVANLVIAVLLITIFMSLTMIFGEEIVRCDVLKIPNCD